MSSLKAWIKKCEGFSSHPYLDSCHILSIGYGRNLDDVGISVSEADFMLDNDIERCQKELSKFSWYYDQPECVRNALVNMCFMGIGKLLTFKQMIAALEKKDYTNAAREALDSRWAKQVGQRAKDVAVMIREGGDGAQGRADITNKSN